MRLLGTFTVVALALFSAPTTTDQQPVANCPAPAVKFRPARIARGGVLTITGSNFGDCLDPGTGGAGPLGSPLTGLLIVIDQGANEFVVANGSADDDYSFRVEVVVPADLEPGEASLNLLGAGDARMEITPSLVISNASPVSSDPATVATFGPQPPTDTEPDATIPPPILPGDIPDEHAVTIPPLSTAPIEIDDGSSETQRRVITVGLAVALAIGALGFALWSRSNRRRW